MSAMGRLQIAKWRIAIAVEQNHGQNDIGYTINSRKLCFNSFSFSDKLFDLEVQG